MVDLGKIVFWAGLGLALFGLLIILFGKLGCQPRLLPGDLYLRRGNFTFVFPVITCLVLSIAATLVLRLLSFWRR